MKNKPQPGPRAYAKVAPLGMANSLIQPLPLLFVGVFARDIIFGNFFRANFVLVGIEGVFNAADYFSLVGLAFLEQFFNALRIHVLRSG